MSHVSGGGWKNKHFSFYHFANVSDDNNTNNKTISIVPWLQVTLFKGGDPKSIKKT